MKLHIVTTITTLIDVGTFETEHSVEINAESAEGLPHSAIYAAVIGACKSTLLTVEKELSKSETPS